MTTQIKRDRSGVICLVRTAGEVIAEHRASGRSQVVRTGHLPDLAAGASHAAERVADSTVLRPILTTAPESA